MRLDYAFQAHLRASGEPNASLKQVQRRIRVGEITVAGQPCTEPKLQFVPGVEATALAACGTALIQPIEHQFYLMHKPEGVVCQRHPREANVYELIPEALRRPDLGCVGRLDRDTTGALLLTTDGGVQSLLLHPSSRVWKMYPADLEPSSTLASDAAAKFSEGMVLEDGTRCAPATLEILVEDDRRVRVTLHEGFFHQVKRMLAHCGGVVSRLHRDTFGALTISNGSGSDVLPGEMRLLTLAELQALTEMLPVDRCAKRDLDGLRHAANDVGDATNTAKRKLQEVIEKRKLQDASKGETR